MPDLLSGFPGFAVAYDSSANPFFKAIMVENLTLLKRVALGEKLLKLIGDAAPQSRGDFPAGVNVMCRPYKMRYVQSGNKLTYSKGSDQLDDLAPSAHPAHNIKGCPFHKYGSSRNLAVDQTQTAKNGTVCYMDFANNQVLESNGAITWPHIVLAHELIHSYHCLYGMHAGADEERKTTGIDEFSDEEFSENAFRAAYKLPRRNAYG